MATLYQHMTAHARIIDYAAQRRHEIDKQIEQLKLEREMFDEVSRVYSSMVCPTCNGQGNIMKAIDGCECDGPRQHVCPSCNGCRTRTAFDALKSNPSMKEFLKDVVGVVEATSYEKLCLWSEWTTEKKKSWIQGSSGYLPTIGKLDGRPIVLSLLIHIVDGYPILFMEPTSQVIDHKMVEDWLKLHLPKTAFQSNGEYVNKVDAMNFHNVFPSRG
jgi:hypothetical protein